MLSDGENTYYYVLDLSGNTQETSHNPYIVGKLGLSMFDGKQILAEFHSHPASYYSQYNRVNAYDGPSFKDQMLANEMGVPVYSIGPHSVSVIKPGGE
ncbi:MAG: hypothetical protein VB102_04355 [Paludibacter sp.]|nr:hypothetical protein [Paludibacter sp.]